MSGKSGTPWIELRRKLRDKLANRATRMRVYYTDDRDPVEVKVTPAVQVAIEHHYDMSLVDLTRVEHVYYMAWAGLQHAGKEPPEFAAFLETIEDVERVEGEEVGPTSPGQ